MSDRKLLERALGYKERGWAPLPCGHGTKGPSLGDKGWRGKVYTAEELRQRFPDGKPMNVGVLLGSVSRGLVDVDLDCREAIVLASFILPPTDATFGRPGKQNSHWLYYQDGDGGDHLPFKDENSSMMLELRRGEGDKRCLTIFPGSTHKDTGELIEWESSGEPARVSKDQLEQKCRQLAAYSLITRRWRKEGRNNLCNAVVGTLLSEGAPLAGVEHLIETIIKVTHDEDAEERRQVVRSLAERVRTRQGRVPGWHKLKQYTNDSFCERFAELFGLKQYEQVEPLPPELVQSANTLLDRNLPPREFIVDGLIYSNSLVMLAAWRGLGKTMVAIHLAVEVACGGEFLHWKVPKARNALYVDGEMPLSDLQERVRKFARGRALDKLSFIASEDYYQLMQAPLNLSNDKQQKRVVALLDVLEEQGRKPELIILDNKSALSTGTDENSNSEQDSFLLFLTQLRHRGHTVLLIHHAGKGGDQRGASRNEDFLDLSIKLEAPKEKDEELMHNERGACFILSITKCRGVRPSPSVLDLELTENSKGAFIWTTGQPKPPGPVQRIVLYLHVRGTPKSGAAMGRVVRINSGNLARELKEARRAGYLEKGELVLTPSGRDYAERLAGTSAGAVYVDRLKEERQ